MIEQRRFGLNASQVAAFETAPLLPGNWHFTRSTTNAVNAVVANTIYATPWIAIENCSLDQISIRVATGAAGNCKVGVALNGANVPAAIVRENSADLDTTSAATLVGTITPLPVIAGQTYWILAAFSGIPSIISFSSAVGQSGGFFNVVGAGNSTDAMTAGNRSRYSAALTYSAGGAFFPATFPAGSYGSGTPGSPVFAMRKA